MNLSTFAGDWFALLFLVSVVYLLVRPRSAARQAVDEFSRAMVAIVQTSVSL